MYSSRLIFHTICSVDAKSSASSMSSTSTDLKSKQPLAKRRSKPSVPKLSVLSVMEDGQVECQLEITRLKTVTFGFNHNEMSAEEVADKLVKIFYRSGSLNTFRNELERLSSKLETI